MATDPAINGKTGAARRSTDARNRGKKNSNQEIDKLRPPIAAAKRISRQTPLAP
ncbi:hypothetical protein KTD18_25855 [Burkholderia multivorans]|uniref:hypothetical protein n=1 Tax=Burkholderia multivorans TaxID=87883 RepID=UPI0015E47CF0|nr:hypothetical protein [Burkholderia multivorans]MBU9294981.1 hypothetical protein [Burkholderia multivorans]